MKRPDPLWIIVLAAVLIGSLVVPVAPRSAATSGGDASEESTTIFHWEAPQSFTGNITAMLRLDLPAEAWCEWDVVASGQLVSPNPVKFWFSTKAGHGLSADYAYMADEVHAHVGPWSTYDLRQTDDYWTMGVDGGTLVTSENHTMTVTVAGFDLADWNGSGSDTPLGIKIACDATFNVTKKGGREGVSFSHETLTDGAGVSHTGVASATVNLRDRLTVDLEGTVTRLQGLYTNDWSDGIDRGNVTLTHPQGTQSWKVPPGPLGTGDSLRMHFDGAPGKYEMKVDLAGAAVGRTEFVGLLIGADPVGSLDEVL